MKIIKEQWRLQIWPPRVCLSSTNKLGAYGLPRPLLANCGGPLATSFQIFNGVGSLLLFAGTSVNASLATMAAERLETARTLARDDARMRWLWSCRHSPSSFFLLQGVCVKDKYGVAYCQCAGSFTGEDCESKSEFAYIAGGETDFKPKLFPSLILLRNHWRCYLRHPAGSAHLDDLRQGHQGQEAREARAW